MRKFFISDIHGNYAAMMRLFYYARVDCTKDQLVIGGDLIDRGLQSGDVLKKAKKLQTLHPSNVQILMGNHEEMMRFYIQGISPMWLEHGGIETIDSLEETFTDNKELTEHIQWACSLPFFYQDDEYFYTHAGLDIHNSLDKQSRDVLWMKKKELYKLDAKRLMGYTNNKKVVHGHTPSSQVTDDGCRISCDTGCGKSKNGVLSLVNLSEQIVFRCATDTFQITETTIHHINHLK